MSTIGSGVGRLTPTPPPDGGVDASATSTGSGGAEGLSPALAGNAQLAAIARGEGTIGLNSRGDAVRLVQARLLEAYPEPGLLGNSGVDGWWGQRSMTALRRFQGEHGLPATGIVDRATLLALDAATRPDATPAPTPTPATPTPAAPPALDPAEAQRLMARTLDDAVRDGLLGAAELQEAERTIAARYGPEVARDVLLECFGVHQGKLEYTAVDYLQGKVGGMAGHIGRYQTLLGENLAGAKLLDTNADGKLDADDLVFTQRAGGGVDVRRVGDALRDELKIAKAMVESCEAMGEAGHDFALIKDHRANPSFFEVGQGGVFTLKPGVKPADAVRDIFESPDKYGFECATAMVIVYYKAMLDLVGDEDFNRICGDLKIGPWAYEGDLASVKMASGSGTEPASADALKALKPGEYRYIRNWDVSAEGKAAGWQGENVIYLGGGKYYGHPFGVASAETIISHLNTHRVDRSFFDRLLGRDNRRDASMVGISGFMTRDGLGFDRNPNG